MLPIKRLAGVAPEVNMRSGMYARKHASNTHPGFETQAPEVQNSGISGPTKGTCVLQKLKKTKQKTKCTYILTLRAPTVTIVMRYIWPRNCRGSTHRQSYTTDNFSRCPLCCRGLIILQKTFTN